MNIHSRLSLFLSSVLISSTIHLYAAEPTDNPLEMSLEGNIETPVVPNKNKTSVREANDHLRNSLERAGFQTSKLRQGEVLMINIPCDKLFRANSMTLSAEGQKLLSKLELLSGNQSKYKMLVTVHTDDTGDESYADIITSDRANEIDDYLSDKVGLTEMIIIPYGIGRDEPLNSNDSIKKRASNRRVEIFLVPQTALFSKSRSK